MFGGKGWGVGYTKDEADEKESYGHDFLSFLLNWLVMRLHMIRETERDISRMNDVIPPYFA